MKIYEFQAYEIFIKRGIPSPWGEVTKTNYCSNKAPMDCPV